MSELSLVKFRSETILVGKVVEKEKTIKVSGTLALASFRRLRLNDDGLLEEMTEADAQNPQKQRDGAAIRTFPMFHLPDEVVTTTNSVEEALAMEMTFHKDDIFLQVPVIEGSLIDRFYQSTIKEFDDNKKLRSNLYTACSTDSQIVSGIYDEKKTKKFFVIQEQ